MLTSVFQMLVDDTEQHCCDKAVLDHHSANELTVHTWLHLCMCVMPSLPLSDTLTHPDTHPQPHQTTWILPHMHTYTHRPWLVTSSSQVTDVCVWGDDSNEYLVTGVMSLPFCLILPPTLILQPFTRILKPTPSFSSRWQPLVPLAHQNHQAGRISQLLESLSRKCLFLLFPAKKSQAENIRFFCYFGRSCGSCSYEIIKTDNNCKLVSQWSAIWQLHQFDWWLWQSVMMCEFVIRKDLTKF